MNLVSLRFTFHDSSFFCIFLSSKKFFLIFTWAIVFLTELLLDEVDFYGLPINWKNFFWMLHQFPYKILQRKLVLGRSYQQRFFHEQFPNEDCGIGSFQIISIIITIWSLTKNSEDGLWISLVGFLSKEPFPMHCIRVKWSPLAFPSVKWFFFFFHPCWR